MKKVIIGICLSLSVSIMTLHASANTLTKSIPNSEQISTEIIDNVEYTTIVNKNTKQVSTYYYDTFGDKITFIKEHNDPNIYYTIHNKSFKDIAVFVNEDSPISKMSSTMTEMQLRNIDSRIRAPWIKTGSSRMVGFKLGGNIVDLGVSAIKGALVSFVTSQSLVAAVIGSAVEVASYIASTGKAYSTNVTLTKYYYGGCTWLNGTEFAFTSTKKMFSYSYSDNPVLGIAPQPCKIASLSYPYH